jgi:glycosyltransferase involved in cell wall biosynthesis
MNITYIISDINKAVFFEHTALLMRERGIEISWILINSEGNDFDIFLKKHNFIIAYLKASSPLKAFPTILSCVKILKNWNTDIIHCHLGLASWIGLWAGLFAGVRKRIFTRHSGKLLHWNYKEAFIDQVQNRLATDIVAISKNIQDLILSQGASFKKIHLIHHGFDLERMKQHDIDEVARIKNRYNASDKHPVIGVVARWLELKGIQYIIPAFKRLLVEYPNAKLCLFNASETAEYAPILLPMLQELPRESYEYIAFESNVYDLYSLFDIYIHTPVDPYCEAFGQTYIEALAAGVPSIFTLSGVAREFAMNEPLATIVPFKDSDAIYDALKKLLDIKPSKEIKTTYFSNFELKVYIQKLLELYKK